MYKSFATWADVLAFAQSGERLFYHAPMDRHPHYVRVVHFTRGDKIRLDPGIGADDFTADEGHLDRFRYQVQS